MLSCINERMERGQDARLLPIVKAAMAEASCSFSQLDRIAVTRGPGSFTGLRIGLAAARGLGLASRKPVIGIDRFSIYAADNPEETSPFLVVLESRRLELYTRLYRVPQQGEEPALRAPDEIIALMKNDPRMKIAGDARGTLKTSVPAEAFTPATQEETIVCAALAAKASPDDVSFLPRPLYLRAPDVTFSACKAN